MWHFEQKACKSVDLPPACKEYGNLSTLLLYYSEIGSYYLWFSFGKTQSIKNNRRNCYSYILPRGILSFQWEKRKAIESKAALQAKQSVRWPASYELMGTDGQTYIFLLRFKRDKVLSWNKCCFFKNWGQDGRCNLRRNTYSAFAFCSEHSQVPHTNWIPQTVQQVAVQHYVDNWCKVAQLGDQFFIYKRSQAEKEKSLCIYFYFFFKEKNSGKDQKHLLTDKASICIRKCSLTVVRFHRIYILAWWWHSLKVLH